MEDESDIDMQESVPEDQGDIDLDPTDYRPGTLLKIKMVNFMCHDSFEIYLGPRVNFVIGPNGSGKSAILTALVVALGGRATVTSRAKRLDEFIKYGKQQARVEVHIHNYKYAFEKTSTAWRPDDYGKFIIVEKIIKQGDSGRSVIRDEQRNIVSDKRDELQQICDHFRIQVDNPIVILNQEVSKSFLHSKRPEDKYNLYMDATLLSKIKEDYNIATVTIQEWRDNCSNKAKSYEGVAREKEVCRSKINCIQQSKKIQEQIVKLEHELLWCYHRDKRDHEMKIAEKIKKADDQLEKCTEESRKLNEKIINHQGEISAFENEKNLTKEELKASQRDIVTTRLRVNELRGNQRMMQVEIQKYESEKSMCERDRNEYEKKLEQLQSEYKDPGTAENDRIRRQKKCELLEREIADLKARETTRRTHMKHQDETLSHIRQDIASALAEKAGVQQKLKQTMSNLERLTNGKENSLRKFGDYMIDLCKEIEHNQTKFRKRPVGPLGNYIQLKNSDCALALETCLKGLSYAFACDNLQDMNTLTNLFKRRFPGQRPPQMITRRFGHKHDISKTRVISNEYPCFLDVIEVKDPVVFNILVDKSSLENILFIPSYEEAEDLMINPARTPENCRCAYTKDGCVMYPKTSESGYRSYTNEDRRALLFDSNVDEHIRRLEAEKQQLQHRFRAAVQKHDAHAARYAANKAESETALRSLEETTKEISAKEEMLLELRHVVDDNPAEIRVFEEELAKIKIKIDSLVEKISDKKRSLQLINNELTTFEERLRGFQQKEEEVTKRISEIERSIEDQQCSIGTKRRKLESLKQTMSKLNQDKVEFEKEHEDAIRLLTECEKELENIDEIPDPRPTAEVNRELKKKHQTIKVQEELGSECFADPVGAVQRLENRILEIDKMKNDMQMSVQNMKKLHQNLKDKKIGFVELTRFTNRMLGVTFAAIMSGMNMQGELNVYVDDIVDPGSKKVVKKAKTLEIMVNTKSFDQTEEGSSKQPSTQAARRSGSRVTKEDGPREGHMSDTRSLSGGERSYSTVAFIISLWKHCHAPFKILDEVDVFMDMVTRRISYNALIDFAISQRERAAQYIFLSPLELPKINDKSLVCVKQMPAPERDNSRPTQA